MQIEPERSELKTERSLRKSGSSTVISLPPQMLEAVNLETGDNVEITANWDDGTLVIEPAD